VLGACNGDDDDDDNGETATETPSGGQTTVPTTSGGTPAVETPTGTPGGQFEGSTDTVEVPAPANQGPSRLVAMRAAAQQGFDRIVFEFAGNQIPGYKVEYVDEAVQCGSGQDVTTFIGGGSAPAAMLMVDMRPADAHNEQGQATAPRDLSPQLQTIKRAFGTCDFEAVTTYVIALSGEEPFKVSTLNDPARLVIDIAQ
jgi:hypothetical protein